MSITRFELPTQEALVDRYCQDVRRLKQRAGVPRPNVGKGSETRIKGEAIASFVLEMMARESALQDATMPDRATGDDLKRLAYAWKGMTPSDGAGASGNVIVTTSGQSVFPQGLVGTAPDGLRYEVVASTVASNGGAVMVRGLDTGKRTNKPAGTVITWQSPPANSDVTAKVDGTGLNNGADPDNDARLRSRFIAELRHPASGGSWSHYQKWAVDSSAAIEEAFVYPALYGPSTVCVAISVAADPDQAYTREPSDALVNTAAQAIVAQSPEHADVSVVGVVNQPVNCVIRLDLPVHRIDGGPGGGWLDPVSVRWPILYDTPVTLTAAPTSPMEVTVSAPTEPVDTAHIAIWSSLKRKFFQTQIITHESSGVGTYLLKLNSPVDTNALQTGDYVSPDAEHMFDYGASLAAAFAGLGPGEMTNDRNYLPRSLRHPSAVREWPYKFGSTTVAVLSNTYSEIRHIFPVTPTMLSPISPTIDGYPNVFVLGKLGFYE